jgi:DNA anti-recombination protein RmuC
MADNPMNPENPVDAVTKTLKDAAYVVVGFGVLAFQKAQVRRRELEKQLGVSTESFREQLTKVAADAEKNIEPVVEAVEASLDQLEERLPAQAREVLKTVRTTAKDAGEQFRARVNEYKATAAA